MSDTDEDLQQDVTTEGALPPEQAAPKPPDWTDEDAAEARAFGWKAPDEWHGERPDGYIDDPRRYMDRANNFRPFKVQREQMARMEADYAERFGRLEAVTAKTLEQQRAQYDRDLAAIKQQQLDAVDAADRQRFDALERQKDALTKPPEMPAPAAKPAIDPEIEAYAKANDWVNNPILRRAGAELIDAGGYASRPAREQLEYAEREVRRLYPHAFAPAPVANGAQPQPQQQRVDPGGLGGGAFKAGAFEALPAEAKATFKRFVEMDIGFKDTPEDRKRYADDYKG
jgi:hypothetical protein